MGNVIQYTNFMKSKLIFKIFILTFYIIFLACYFSDLPGQFLLYFFSVTSFVIMVRILRHPHLYFFLIWPVCFRTSFQTETQHQLYLTLRVQGIFSWKLIAFIQLGAGWKSVYMVSLANILSFASSSLTASFVFELLILY